MKQEFKSGNTCEQPWSHITNFQYNKQELINAFIKVGFKIKSTEFIHDELNPATIFVLIK